jgi:hypothetical protein
MNFDQFMKKRDMRKVIIGCVMILGIVSCTATKSADSARAARRAIKAEETRLAVESLIQQGSYLVKIDRLYSGRVSNAYLSPVQNFILVDKGQLRMKVAYLGRSFSIRGIAAINMTAHTEKYEVVRDSAGKRYDVSIKASQAGEPFDIFLTIYDNGYAVVSVTNPNIETLRYNGKLTLPSAQPGS